MKIAIFDAKNYDKKYFDLENNGRHEIVYFEENLSTSNAHLAQGFDAACGFVNTPVDADVIKALAANGVKVWLQRSMGYNRVDLKAAAEHGIKVFRVPNYSAETVGEHAVSLLMSLNRRLPEAKRRTENWDFHLDGLTGKCLQTSTVGVVGSGKIGQTFIKIMKATGAKVVVFDEFAQANFPQTAAQLGFEWATLDELLAQSDFISLHAPLLPTTKHMINKDAIAKMKKGVILINAARGELINTTDMIEGLKSGIIAGVGLDVLEREAGRFYFDRSADASSLAAEDQEWAWLLKQSNVLITAHQAFFTELALTQIARVSLANADDAQAGNFEKALELQADGKVKNG